MMRRMGRAVLPGIAVTACLVGFGVGQVSASGGSAPDRPETERAQTVEGLAPDPSFVSGNLVQKKTYLSRGRNALAVTASTWTAVDDLVTIRCPGKSGSCVVTADMNVQFVAGATDASVNLCPYVDGNGDATDLTCGLIVGFAPMTFGWDTQHFVHTFRVKPGSHMVQTYLNATASGDMAWYSNVYTVYRKAG